MDSTRQIFQISKFLNTLSFVIIPRMLWGNLMKINQIYTSYKFAQSCCIPPYIKHEILAPKGSQTTCAMPGDYLTSWNCTPIGQRDLLVSMMMDQDFSGKVIHCSYVFFLSWWLSGVLRRMAQWWPSCMANPWNIEQIERNHFTIVFLWFSMSSQV